MDTTDHTAANAADDWPLPPSAERLRELPTLVADVIFSRGRRSGLAVGDASLEDTLPSLFATAEPQPPVDLSSVGELAEAVLLLFLDRDEESHSVSQRHEGTVLFDHAHAIMHRREADFGNAAYWARRITDSPVFGELPAITNRSLVFLAGAGLDGSVLSTFEPLTREWDAGLMLDCVRQARDIGSDDAELCCRTLQFDEMLTLLMHGF